MLGALEVVVGPAVLPIAGRKERALLASLALHAGRPVPVDTLVRMLWDEDPPRTVDKVLQTYVSHLRRILPDGSVVTRGASYFLDVPEQSVDASRFEHLVHRARSHRRDGDLGEASVALHEALGLWRGHDLPDLGPTPAARAAVTRLTELRLTVLEERIEADLALGRHAELVGELEESVTAFPLREALWSHLMVALYRCGRQAEALRAAQRARRILAEELGLELSPELRRLEAAVLAHHPDLEAPRRADVRDGEGEPGLSGFVGRVRELGELTAALGALPSGHGSFFLVTGEPGIGKTRLAEELSTKARARGVTVAWGSAWEGRGAPPFWPWVQVLRSLQAQTTAEVVSEVDRDRKLTLDQIVSAVESGVAHRLARAADPDADRFALFDDMAAVLERLAGHRPMLIVLDDVHAADLPTLVFLDFVARRVRRRPIVILAAAREVETRLDAAVARSLANTTRFGRRLPLRGLPEAAVATLVRAAADAVPSERLVGWLHGATGGNPFFLDELLRLLLAEGRLDTAHDRLPDVPDGVRETVRRRIEPLSADARHLLTAAAVVGRDFDLAVVERACQYPPLTARRLIDEAETLDLVAPIADDPVRHRFAHALVREALYDELEPAARATLHHRVGEILEFPAMRPAVAVAELAHHFRQAAPVAGPDKAVDYSVAAAQEAMSRLAYEDAVRQYRFAVDAIPLDQPGCQGRRARLLVALSDAHQAVGEYVEAGQAALDAAEAGRALGDNELLGEAALRVPIRDGRGEPAMGYVALALDSVGDEPSALRARLLVRRALAEVNSIFDQRAVESVHEGLAVARRLDDADALFDCLRTAHILVLRSAGSTAERRAVTDELTRVAPRCSAPEGLLDAHFARIFDDLDAGDLAGFDRTRTEYMLLAERMRSLPRLRSSARFQVIRLLLAGRFGEAEPTALALLAEKERLDEPLALVQTFHLRHEQGRLAELEQSLRALTDEHPQYPWRPRLAVLLAEQGRYREAREEFEVLAVHRFADVNFTKAGFVLPLLAEVCAYLGDRTRAEHLYRRLLPFDGRCVVVGGAMFACTGAYARYLGLLATTLERWDDAERHLRDALAMHEAMPSPPLVARTLHDLAAFLVARGRPGDAALIHRLAARSAASAREMGMSRLAAQSAALAEGTPKPGALTAP